MKKTLMCLFALVCLIASTYAPRPAEAQGADDYWPHWRGPNADGSAPNANPPTEWSEEKNVRWKAAVPGKGSATPIVWGDMVIVQTAVPTGQQVATAGEQPTEPQSEGGRRRRGPAGIAPDGVLQFTVIAFDRSTGAELWKTVVSEGVPHEGTHPTGTWASASPVTDGERIYSFFGSRGLYCLDLEGKVIWDRDFGDMQIRLGFGEGASPVLAGDRVIVNWDHEGPSFIAALDKLTGQEVWRTERDEITSWSTPLVVTVDGRQQVITSATGKVRSYDVSTGELIWESTGMTLNAIPTPVAADGIAYVTSGFRGNALLAVRLSGARGDVTGSDAIVWSHDRDTPYTPSPLLYRGVLYFLKSNNGILSAFEAATGEPLFPTRRIDGVPNVYASPVGAANRIYVTGREGTVAVLEHGTEARVLAVNTLDDGFDASPALVDGEIYLRGRESLYCIADDAAGDREER